MKNRKTGKKSWYGPEDIGTEEQVKKKFGEGAKHFEKDIDINKVRQARSNFDEHMGTSRPSVLLACSHFLSVVSTESLEPSAAQLRVRAAPVALVATLCSGLRGTLALQQQCHSHDNDIVWSTTGPGAQCSVSESDWPARVLLCVAAGGKLDMDHFVVFLCIAGLLRALFFCVWVGGVANLRSVHANQTATV